MRKWLSTSYRVTAGLGGCSLFSLLYLGDTGEVYVTTFILFEIRAFFNMLLNTKDAVLLAVIDVEITGGFKFSDFYMLINSDLYRK